jgi:hypothetical protein
VRQKNIAKAPLDRRKQRAQHVTSKTTEEVEDLAGRRVPSLKRPVIDFPPVVEIAGAYGGL